MKKSYENILIVIVALVAIIGISLKSRNTREKTTLDEPTVNVVTEDNGDCAKAGERSISNFDMTKGRINPEIEPKECCPGLVNIADKQPASNTNPEVCAMQEGVPINLCSPCGNGICDTEYEDVCNCPEDCKMK